ncbi:MAG TPA: hypothetical protein VHG71_09020 [Verrucomicrobiae bacterium]|nr:hypothetical protein [Verrucomicrobiae bacterium]
MQTKKKSFQPGGYALLITMVFIGITLLLLVSVMSWANSNAKQTHRNNMFNTSSAAAEAAAEAAVAYMERDFYNQSLNTNASIYTTNLPSQTSWPIHFTFSDTNGTANRISVSTSPANWTTNIVLLGNQYQGLFGAVAQCTVIATATPSNQLYNVPATVKEEFQLASIPIFQFAIFYNLNMEIDPGAAMSITGPVFSNGGIWAGTGNLTFNSTVKAVNSIYTSSTNFPDPFGPKSKTDSGLPTFNGGTPLGGQDALSMPIGTNTSATAVRDLLGLPPTNVVGTSLQGQQYFYNAADLIVSNSSSGVISNYYRNQDGSLSYIAPDVATYTTNGSGSSKTITTNYNNYSFVTNVSFYDYREGKTVSAVQVDVSALNKWLTNNTTGIQKNTINNTDKGHAINSIYVYNNATASSTKLPSVRMVNGSVLPSAGLTVVTPDPLYVLGNYNATGSAVGTTNTANTAPAALMGDSLTILSTNWNDSKYTNGYSLSNRNPSATTVNAAAFEGIVQSTTNDYSGGVENFLRLLENWGSSTALTYNGSIVVMFPSQFATNRWQQTGNYYNAPKRAWAFDLNFKQQSKTPPLTPSVKALIRQRWSAY